MSFSAASYNVFIGTALPLFVHPSDFVPLLGSPGAGAARLSAQVSMLRSSGVTDLLALQELHDDNVAKVFAKAFDSSHIFLSSKLENVRGALCFWAWRCALLTLAAAFVKSAGLSFGVSAALVAMASACIMSYVLPERCTAAQFLLSSTVGGLGILVRRDKWRVVAFETRAFAHQEGDFLNTFKPRAYSVVLLEELHAQRSRLLVIHTHASLGSAKHRGRQLAEAVAAASPAAVSALLQRARPAKSMTSDYDDTIHAGDSREPIACVFLGDFNATYEDSVGSVAEPSGFTDAFSAGKGSPFAYSWDNKNPLARDGILKCADERVDHILFRAGAGVGQPAFARIVFNDEPFLSDHFGVRVDFCRSLTESSNSATSPSSPRSASSGFSTPTQEVQNAVSRSGSFDEGPDPGN